MKRSLLALPALAAALFLLPTAPEAQADAGKAKACLDELVQGAAAQGRRLRATDSDSAGVQEAVDYRVTLYKGMTYVLVGCADGEEVDLDIRLYDADGNLVDKDGSPDAKPFVFVEPEKTGEYAMQVIVHQAKQPKTDFAVAVTYQY